MSKLEKLKEKAKGLEAKDPRGAIEAWLEVLKTQESEGEANPDLSVFNRVGDLYTKVKDPATAADYYDRAVDRYAELGFHNNAIAMCNKVLRNAPARQTTYLKLAKLYAAKGFIAEAKQNFVEYAERMQRAGKLQHAFAALKEFTDISPESDQLRGMLEEHLRLYGEPQRVSSVGGAAPKVSKPAADDLSKSGKHKTSTLVFLDVDAPAAPKAAPGRPSASRPPSPPRAPPRASLIEEVTPEPDTSLEIESTSLVEGFEPASAGGAGTLDGLETTQLEYGNLAADALGAPSLREEPVADDVEPMAELEPTVPPETDRLEPMLDQELEIEAPAPPPPPRPRVTLPKVAPPKVAPPKVGPPRVGPPKVAPPSPPKVTPVVPRRPGQPPAPQRLTMPKVGAPAELPKVKPVVPKRPPESPKRKTMVEVPPLELEPDFDQPLEVEEAPPAPARASGFIDIGFEGMVGDQSASLVFANIEEAPSAPTIEELETRVADDPDDPEGHQALGEALIEQGERERGIEELDHATNGYEAHGNLTQALTLVEEILRLDPNSVRHRQKLVEFAFKAGDKPQLVEAYLELADTLLRQDLPDKARAVYRRVAEHDPKNERAKAALAMLAPAAAPAAAAPASKAEGRVAPKDAKMKVRAEAEAEGDFVDLSAMILEEVPVERNTRMKIEDEEPTGDEERDFQGMLARFRQGIEENIDEADFQSHYDLGIAFKEMGLLDEAIAELQKALRAPEGKLKTSEALGTCFVEKGAHVVAESILRRGLDLPASGDDDRLGVLYWLGRALEGLGKRAEARELYGRVFAVDIRFRDVADRVKALGKAK